MSEKQHVYYFDYLRLIASVSVIYMHVAAGPLRATINMDWHLMNILTCFGFTAVPLFFMMSGYLLLSNPKTENVDILIRKRIPRLLIPLIGWTVVALLWKVFLYNDTSIFKNGLLSSLKNPAWVHFWYMYTLIAIYIIAPILSAALRTLDKKGHILIFVIACIPSVKIILQLFLPTVVDEILNIDIISKLTLLGGHLNTFILGYFLGNLKKKIPNWLLVLSGAIILSIIVVGTFYLTTKTGSFNQTFQNQSAGLEVLLAAIMFLFFKQNYNFEGKFFKIVPILPLSLSIYLMHNILLSMMSCYITIVSFFDTIFVMILNLVICFVVMKTVATIKPICFIATGMSYQNACESCNWIYTYSKIKEKNFKTKKINIH